MFRSKTKDRKQVKKKQFFIKKIKSCPLSMKVKCKQKESFKMLQLIMDYIPLSFYKHPDHPYSFYNRLRDSMKSKCCFISNAHRN